ncbi:MAG: hemolysin III family protein [Bacteroidota bacterium]
MTKQKRTQSQTEEWFNSISHGITALSAIGGFFVLVVYGATSEKEWSLFSAFFYGSSLVALYTFSTLYHGLKHEKAKKFFKILDHCGIFLLIAGTYTPALLIVIGGTTGWIFFAIQWGMALSGIVLKIFYTGRFKLLSTLIYAVMGWIIVFKVELLAELLPTPAFWLLASGGLAYTFGIIFYILDSRIKYGHFIWHLFVMAGSILHYLMMVMYIFN